MDAFRVKCETCGSRLKVRSADVIGEIHACPKCGSMVQIAPPADWTADAVAPVAAVSAAAGPALTISTSLSTIIPADFAASLAAEPIAEFTPEPTASAAPTPIAQPAAAGISPIVWTALGGAALFFVAGLTFVLWPSGDKRGDQTVIPPATAIAKTEPVKPIEPAAEKPSAPEIDPYAVDHSKAAHTEPTSAPPVKPIESSPAVAAATTPTDKPQTAPAASQKTADSPPTASAPAPVKSSPPTAVATFAPTKPTDRPDAAPSNSASGGDHVLKFDPLDFDPEHLSMPSPQSKPLTSSTPAPSTASVPLEPPVEPAPTVKLPAPEAPAIANNVLPPPTATQAASVRRGPTTADNSRPLDVKQHLATTIKSLQLSDMPLTRFAQTISDCSGVPITLDPLALELSGISPRSAVSVDVANVPLEKVLRDALTNQRLDLVVEEGVARTALPNADERKSADFDVKDLVVGTDAAPIAKLVERFVAPETWQSAGGKDTIEVKGASLHIEQSLTVRREVLIFCERLRIARGLPIRSKYPPTLLTVDSPYEKLAATLRQPTTFTFLAWTRLGEVFRQWQEMSGVTILVDWSALCEAELGPTSPLACATINHPWIAAIDSVLEPLHLSWWAIDGQTIQITSLDALDRIERVEFYSVPKKLHDQYPSADALIAALQKEIGDRPNKPAKPADVRIELDEPSHRLIVRATPAIQRFLSDRLAAATK